MSDETRLNLGLLLFIPYRQLENRVLGALAAIGYDITLAQARVFQRIGPDGTRLTELAEAAQVTKQAAGFLVDQLERSGYVERVADPVDGRAKLVRIAPRGRQAIEQTLPVLRELEAEWERHLGPRRMAQLRDTLERLRQITDPFA